MSSECWSFSSGDIPGNVRGPWEKQTGTVARKRAVLMSFKQRDEEEWMTWMGCGEGGDFKGNMEHLLKACFVVIKEQ